MATIGSNRRFSIESKGPSFPSVAFLWPALAAEQASEFAAAIAKEFAKLAGGSEPQQPSVEPEWTTRNEVTLELESVRLRDFSTSPDGVATLDAREGDLCRLFLTFHRVLMMVGPLRSSWL